jgi:hypothetical protein
MSEILKRGGGDRPGAGRPPGHKNKKTIAREMAQRNVIDETLSRLTGEEIERLTPLEVMQLGMHLMLRAGNITAAVAMAEKVAPFIRPKMSSSDIIHRCPRTWSPIGRRSLTPKGLQTRSSDRGFGWPASASHTASKYNGLSLKYDGRRFRRATEGASFQAPLQPPFDPALPLSHDPRRACRTPRQTASVSGTP